MPGVTTRNRLVKRVGGRVHLVQSLPGDQHRHHDGLACAGRHLQCHPRQPGVVSGVLRFQPGSPVGVSVPLSRDLSQEDRRLRCLSLAEQHPVLALRVRPMLQQLAADRRDPGVLSVRAPARHVSAQVVDERVLLTSLAGGVEVQRDLLARLLALRRHRDRDERLARPPTVPDLARRAPLADHVVAVRRIIRLVQDRVVDGRTHPVSPTSSRSGYRRS